MFVNLLSKTIVTRTIAHLLAFTLIVNLRAVNDKIPASQQNTFAS